MKGLQIVLLSLQHEQKKSAMLISQFKKDMPPYGSAKSGKNYRPVMLSIIPPREAQLVFPRLK